MNYGYTPLNVCFFHPDCSALLSGIIIYFLSIKKVIFYFRGPCVLFAVTKSSLIDDQFECAATPHSVEVQIARYFFLFTFELSQLQ